MLAALAALACVLFPTAWSAAPFATCLQAPACLCLLLAGEGFILARAAGDEAEILTLAVAPAARRQGLARALVGGRGPHAAAWAHRALFLGSREPAMIAAQGSIAGWAFADVGRRKAYYGHEDADVLKVALPLAIRSDSCGFRLTLPGNTRARGPR